MSDRSPAPSPEAEPSPPRALLTATDPLREAMQTESDARDRLAEFAGAWAGSVYQSSPFFGELRRHLDAYRDAVQARVESERHRGNHGPRPRD